MGRKRKRDDRTPQQVEEARQLSADGKTADPPKAKEPQGRSWCLTLWSEEAVGRLKACPGVVAMVAGHEICPDTGKEHWQTYVRFETNKRFGWWKVNFPGQHYELRRGSEAEAAEYCRKDGKVLVDFGCAVSDAEPSGDIAEHVLDLLEAGAPLWQVYRQHRKFFFMNYRKISDMEGCLHAWRENGVSFERIKGPAVKEGAEG